MSETCNTGMVNKQPLQRCGKNTYLFASQNTENYARGVVDRIVNLSNDTSRKIIICSND
ncbi:DUF2574 family protein [Klebsiella quasipneumoniae]|nr:DUF2574 family protein [Klebsiella quasipneumoniae]HBR0923451.1 DUF2574 family protein [Klebsiella quasipneumoniae subsp. quasipneumoniae]HDZ9751208.1 DUF2574 family protein [Klebsiella quasipneumoniae subsp. similipneumoniae]EMB9110942.1 DUF2574 family protein [Klebsiella quasipneumoniae]EME4042581.1 DUF2574 family protein [Klebsiella quasipneumoniae]